jgi:hypothetical protein
MIVHFVDIGGIVDHHCLIIVTEITFYRYGHVKKLEKSNELKLSDHKQTKDQNRITNNHYDNIMIRKPNNLNLVRNKKEEKYCKFRLLLEL